MTALRVLGVHGVKNYQPGLTPADAAARLTGWWDSAMRKGLGLPGRRAAALAVRVAYYAHRLHEGTAHGDGDPAVLDGETQVLVGSWAGLFGAPAGVAQGAAGGFARAAADWVAGRYGLDQRAVRVLTASFFGEVQAYFTDDARRGAAIGDVAAAIRELEPHVVIAHSLGSVVAYETLWTYPHPPVDLLITVGSPLAMPNVVYDRLRPHDGPRGRPHGVTRWINIADPGDFIAIPVGGIQRSFQGLSADLTDAVGAFSFHQVGKYLSCGATAGALAACLPPD